MKRIKDVDIHKGQNITGAIIKRKREAAGLSQLQLSQQLETMAIYVAAVPFPELRTVQELFLILS